MTTPTEAAPCEHRNSERYRNRRGEELYHDHGGRGGHPAYRCLDCDTVYCADERCRGYGPEYRR